MHIHLVSLFPQSFESFFTTSILGKAQEKGILSVSCVNPRDFCNDKHKTVDDEPYGGGNGMVIKVEPVVKAIESVIETIEGESRKVIMPAPTKEVFCQSHALSWSSYEHLIFVCGRYEGIDARFDEHMRQTYPKHFERISLGQFILLGGEVASMTMIEAVARLVPGVIKETGSWQNESYNPLHGMKNLECPQYTRPENFRDMKVPEVLLGGDQKAIAQWREKNAG